MTVRQAVASILFSLGLALLFVIASCRPSHAGQGLSVSPSSLTFTAAGFQSVKLTQIGKKADWTVSVNAPWLTVSPIKGKGSATLTVTAAGAGLTGINTAVVYVRTGTSTATFSVTFVTPPPQAPPPPPVIVACGSEGGTADCGPQPSILCPTGATYLPLGTDLARALATGVDGQTFCLQAGDHYPSAPIRPTHTGQTVVGEYGAVVHGRDVVQSYDIGGTAIFSGWNCYSGCSGFTLRNVLVRDRPAYPYAMCVGWFGPNGWTLDHVEIAGCYNNLNISGEQGARLSHVYSHDPVGGCSLAGYQTQQTTIEDSEFNGTVDHGCKFADSGDMTIRRNWFHGTGPYTAALWLDTSGYSIPHTCHSVTDNLFDAAADWAGVDIEAVHCAVLTNNRVRQPAGATASGLYITISSNVTVDGWTFEAPSGGGVRFFYDERPVDYPVENNVVRNSTFLFSGTPLQVAGFACTGTQAVCSAYYASHNNVFTGNTYVVADTQFSYWWNGGPAIPFAAWQQYGQDIGSTVSVR